MDAAGAEALLRDQEAGTRLAERVADRHAHVRVAHLAMCRPALALVTHDGDRLDDVDAWGVGGDDDLCRARVRCRVRVADRHDDSEGRALRSRREPLVAVDHPVVAVTDRARAQCGRVRTGNIRLGHREERTDVARDERTEPALLLLARPEVVKDLGVAGVGRLAAEDELAEARAADVLVQVRVVEEAGAGAASFGWHVRRPEAELAHLVAESTQELLRLLRPVSRSRPRSGARGRS